MKTSAIVIKAEYKIDGCDDVHLYTVITTEDMRVVLSSDKTFVVGDIVDVSISVIGKIH